MARGIFDEVSNQVGQEATEQENQAFALKLQSAKLEAEHQARLSEEASRVALQQQAEREKFARESPLSSGVSKVISDTLGKDVGELKQGDLPAIDTLLRAKQMGALRETRLDPQYDDNGLIKSYQASNGLGMPIGGPHPATGYEQDKQSYDKLTTYNAMLNRAGQLYNTLSAHNALGTGSILNRLPEDMIPLRSELLDLTKQTGPLQSAVIEGVPGGRYAQTLSESLSSGQPLPQKAAQVMNDELANNKLLIYAKLRRLSSMAKMPQDLVDSFAGLPHDINGNVINPQDLSVVNGNIYQSGHPDPIGRYGTKFLSVHPQAQAAFANEIQGRSQGPFDNDEAFNAALSAARARNK